MPGQAQSAAELAAPSARAGFTLVELLTTCVIVSIIAMGTYGLLGQTLRTETTANLRARASAVAVPVLEHLASAITQARECGNDLPSIQAEPGMLTLLTSAGPDGTSQRRRYSWRAGAHGNVSLEMKSFYYAGATPLACGSGADSANEEAVWDGMEARTIATGLEQLKLEYLAMDVDRGRWSDKYEGAAAVAVRVRLWSMGRMFERVIVPPAHLLGTVYGGAQDTEDPQ